MDRAKKYLELYYKDVYHPSETIPIVKFRHRELIESFSREDVHGEWLLDLGSGPTIFASLYASRKFPNIVLSDYDDDYRIELVKWCENAKDAYNWEKFIKFTNDFEKNSINITERTQNAIKFILPIDLTKQNPLKEGTWLKKFDCIMTSLCIESVATDFDSFSKIISNVSRHLLKPGGLLIMTGTLRFEFYKVGDELVTGAYLENTDIENSLTQNQHEIIVMDTEMIGQDNDHTKYGGSFLTISKYKPS